VAAHTGNPLDPLDRRRPPNALALACIAIFLVLLGGQILTGWRDHDNDARAHHQHGIGLAQYLTTGHFYEATFENWESEFLQAAAYVVLTIWLVQLGSAESKDPDGDAVDEDPRLHRDEPDAPWPVRRGGDWLRLYENSLLVAFVVLFLGAVVGHALGGTAEYNTEARQHHEAPISTLAFVRTSSFWFQSFQNWQSEFLAVGAIVGLSVVLRQRGSAQSKPVAAPNSATGSG
jgi:hypothetical protein